MNLPLHFLCVDHIYIEVCVHMHTIIDSCLQKNEKNQNYFYIHILVTVFSEKDREEILHLENTMKPVSVITFTDIR